MLILSITLGVLLAVAVCLLVLLKRDIRQMSAKLGGIAEMDTNAQVATSTYDKSMVALADSINNTLERNRRDSHEKARAEADLKRAITNISHDLRTPLTSALGYLQMLEAYGLDDETRARYLATIKGRLEALSVLMNSLFEFAQVIEGKTEFSIQKINIGGVLRSALSDSSEEFENRGFKVEVDIPDEPVMCFCDEDALQRVVQNLLKNVYTHGAELLSVSLAEIEPRENGCIIRIANKVDGLDELEIERLFDRFYTADASRTSKNTGLGLAIAKELTERMGGQITAYRQRQGDSPLVFRDADVLVMQIQLPQ